MKETREIEQTKVFVLYLNDMRSSNIENTQPVVLAYNLEELKTWYREQLAEGPWKDDRWHKIFKKGGALEWYNAASSLSGIGPMNDGVSEEWAQQENIEQFIAYHNPIIIPTT